MKFPKSAKGSTTKARRSRASREQRITLLKKTEAKIRDDFRCRVPGCVVRGKDLVEAAHLEDSGMGGRFSVSNQRQHFVALCRSHHQGRRSIHTTHMQMIPLSDAGGDGPVAFYTRARISDPWTYLGQTNGGFSFVALGLSVGRSA